MPATCRSCGEPIRWAKTREGKNIPLDYEPGARGTFVLQGDRDDVSKPMLALRMKDELARDRVDLYSCHIETCRDRSG